MKLFLIVILLILTILFSIIIYLKYLIICNLYMDLGLICKELKNNISFRKIDIPTILDGIYPKVKFTSRCILTKGIGVIPNDIQVLIDNFMGSLGHGDIDFEINNIGYYEKIFEEQRNIARDDLNTKGLTYSKLVIGLGLIICIILL